jgi:hypothetical protein
MPLAPESTSALIGAGALKMGRGGEGAVAPNEIEVKPAEEMPPA